MIEIQKGELRYFQFESLQDQGLFHGIYSRKGGVSPAPWESLNLGGTVGDTPENVKENLDRLLKTSGFSASQLVQVRQIHSARVIWASRPVDAVEEGDAITADRPGLLLLMRFADCVPVLFYDPEHRAVSIAHAGWKGTLKGVVAEVVRAMKERYGTSPRDLRVGIGPSIGPDHYQVGGDVINMARAVFPKEHEQILLQEADGVKLDLWKANKIHLRKAGVEQIEIAGICTGCNLEHWYSHRAENGKSGRFAAVIGLL